MYKKLDGKINLYYELNPWFQYRWLKVWAKIGIPLLFLLRGWGLYTEISNVLDGFIQIDWIVISKHLAILLFAFIAWATFSMPDKYTLLFNVLFMGAWIGITIYEWVMYPSGVFAAVMLIAIFLLNMVYLIKRSDFFRISYKRLRFEYSNQFGYAADGPSDYRNILQSRKCPKCGGEHIRIEKMTETIEKTDRDALWWISLIIFTLFTAGIYLFFFLNVDKVKRSQVEKSFLVCDDCDLMVKLTSK